MKNKVLMLIVLTVLSICLLMFLSYKPDIHEATYDELISINGIGEVLAERVSLYLQQNPDSTLDDLDKIPGIGEKKIKLISKRWCD